MSQNAMKQCHNHKHLYGLCPNIKIFQFQAPFLETKLQGFELTCSYDEFLIRHVVHL